MAERLSLISSWGAVSEPADPGRTNGCGQGGQVTVKADVGTGKCTLAWEAGGHQELGAEKGPFLHSCSLP